jgi:DsbC/DsbD-like thiol-disulfide interchange protein
MHRITGRVAAFLACVVVAGAVTAAPKKSEDNVKIAVKADKPVDGKQVVTLTLDVAKGWHAYANPVGHVDLTDVQTVVTFSAGGKTVPAKVEYPAGKLVKDNVIGEYKVYEGTVTIKATIDRPADGSVEATVKFQTCTETMCLLPSTVKVKVE